MTHVRSKPAQPVQSLVLAYMNLNLQKHPCSQNIYLSQPTTNHQAKSSKNMFSMDAYPYLSNLSTKSLENKITVCPACVLGTQLPRTNTRYFLHAFCHLWHSACFSRIWFQNNSPKNKDCKSHKTRSRSWSWCQEQVWWHFLSCFLFSANPPVDSPGCLLCLDNGSCLAEPTQLSSSNQGILTLDSAVPTTTVRAHF